VAPACKIVTSENRQSISCPSSATLKVQANSLITSGAPYPVRVESAVSSNLKHLFRKNTIDDSNESKKNKLERYNGGNLQ